MTTVDLSGTSICLRAHQTGVGPGAICTLTRCPVLIYYHIGSTGPTRAMRCSVLTQRVADHIASARIIAMPQVFTPTSPPTSLPTVRNQTEKRKLRHSCGTNISATLIALVVRHFFLRGVLSYQTFIICCTDRVHHHGPYQIFIKPGRAGFEQQIQVASSLLYGAIQSY